MHTLAELREVLGTWGFPGDLREFEEELGAADLDDLTAIREVIQAYRRRLVGRYDPNFMAALACPTDDVADEIRRKMKLVCVGQ
ncbi:hypothetical protein [Streptomyces acidiscabies]|uniref:hypothetical protein n=1 Tax=Streptomyces acidiscabies TaxID=42234 RepID=UPI00067ACA26|nr:hypothetical protein [Streptomyces acidiscabies]